jgi:hypothetical protein
MKTESLQQKKHLSLHPFGASPNWSPNSTCRFCLKELLHRTCVQGCPRSWQSKIAFIIADFPASAEHNLCSTNQQTFQWHFHLMEPVSIQKPSFDFFNSGLIRLIMFNIYIYYDFIWLLWLYMTCRDPRSKDHTFGGPISPAQNRQFFFAPWKHIEPYRLMQIDAGSHAQNLELQNDLIWLELKIVKFVKFCVRWLTCHSMCLPARAADLPAVPVAAVAHCGSTNRPYFETGPPCGCIPGAELCFSWYSTAYLEDPTYFNIEHHGTVSTGSWSKSARLTKHHKT